MKKLIIAALAASALCAGSALADTNNTLKSDGGGIPQSNTTKADWERVERQAKQETQGAKYSSCTPNPFALCSGPRPGKKHKSMRRCWDSLCR
ncbi:MAG: hypothetical protein FWC40_09880 [Proteobacteria bacterium]|nr:hypothetical protein [Pseudomonadota bacterium]